MFRDYFRTNVRVGFCIQMVARYVALISIVSESAEL